MTICFSPDDVPDLPECCEHRRDTVATKKSIDWPFDWRPFGVEI